MLHSYSQSRARGFSLIELLTAIAIIGILAGIAYPSYRAYMRTANRTDATRTMLAAAQALQRCFSQNYTYASSCPTVAGTTTSPGGYYSITIAIPSASSYTITATPTGAQASDTQCASFTLQSSGQQQASSSAGTDVSTSCWGST